MLLGQKQFLEALPIKSVVENDVDVINAIFDKHPNTSIYYASEILKEYPNSRTIQALDSKLC